MVGLISRIFGSSKPSDFLRRRSVLFGSAVLIPLIAVLTFASVSPPSQSLPETGFASFTCNSSLRNRTFTFSVEVNLADGMDKKEATAVAIAAFGEAIDMGGEGATLRECSTMAELVDGTWKVRVNSIFSSGVYGPCKDNYEGGSVAQRPGMMTMMVDSFHVTIDPNTRIVDFVETLMPID